MDDEVAPVLLVLPAPDELGVEVGVAGVLQRARHLLLLLEHGPVLGGGDVLALVLRVAEGLDGLGAGGLSCHGIPPHGRSA